jgi:hypothetical protein
MPLATPPPPIVERAPILVHDRREAHPLTSVDGRGPTVYARRSGPWLQYWLYYAQNTQDRGIVRTGRHAGDWELVQVHAGTGEVVASQHSGAERCPSSQVRRRDGHPVIYVAHGSHANYLRPGVRDRHWPDPNDEAPGDGLAVMPRVETITATSPAWMRRREPWGGARARLPFEQGSPRGPAFQGVRWDDPQRFADEASSCRAERCRRLGDCDGPENAQAGLAAGLLLLAGVAIVNRGETTRRRLLGRARAILRAGAARGA